MLLHDLNVAHSLLNVLAEEITVVYNLLSVLAKERKGDREVNIWIVKR